MHIPKDRVVVEKVEEEKKDGEFGVVQVQDSSTFKGRVVELPSNEIVIDKHTVVISDVLLFAQNSPDTHQITHEGKEVKFIIIDDILAVL